MTDSVSGQPLAVTPTLIIKGTTFVDTLPRNVVDGTYDGRGFTGLIDRGGTFTLEVKATGYQTWTRTDVVIAQDRCGGPVSTVTVMAKLQPS